MNFMYIYTCPCKYIQSHVCFKTDKATKLERGFQCSKDGKTTRRQYWITEKWDLGISNSHSIFQIYQYSNMCVWQMFSLCFTLLPHKVQIAIPTWEPLYHSGAHMSALKFQLGCLIAL